MSTRFFRSCTRSCASWRLSFALGTLTFALQWGVCAPDSRLSVDATSFEANPQALAPAAQLSLAGEPNNLVGDGAYSRRLTATLLSATGSPLTGQALTFSSPTAGVVFSPNVAVTNCQGVATTYMSSVYGGNVPVYAGVRSA